MIVNEKINTISEEQVLHNKLSFEINQELIHLMKRIVELQQENARLKEERKQIKEYVEKCNFDNAEILFDFGSEYCYIDDFKEHILEILKEN